MRRLTGADAADRLHAMMLHRALNPPLKQKRRPHHRTPSPENHVVNSWDEDKLAEGCAQRACDFAQRRAADLDRTADLLLSFGQYHAAERLAHLAAELREVAL